MFKSFKSSSAKRNDWTMCVFNLLSSNLGILISALGMPHHFPFLTQHGLQIWSPEIVPGHRGLLHILGEQKLVLRALIKG